MAANLKASARLNAPQCLGNPSAQSRHEVRQDPTGLSWIGLLDAHARGSGEFGLSIFGLSEDRHIDDMATRIA